MRIYIYIYTHLYVYIYTNVYTCIYIYIHTYVHVYIYIYIYIHTYSFIKIMPPSGRGAAARPLLTTQHTALTPREQNFRSFFRHVVPP